MRKKSGKESAVSRGRSTKSLSLAHVGFKLGDLGVII